jgi:hypothetical protein
MSVVSLEQVTLTGFLVSWSLGSQWEVEFGLQQSGTSILLCRVAVIALMLTPKDLIKAY